MASGVALARKMMDPSRVTVSTATARGRAERVEELVHRVLAALTFDSDHPAGVMVGDHGQVTARLAGSPPAA
jgi:hypothetical protein